VYHGTDTTTLKQPKIGNYFCSRTASYQEVTTTAIIKLTKLHKRKWNRTFSV